MCFHPKNAIAIQRDIGADIIMAFDECTPYPCSYDILLKILCTAPIVGWTVVLIFITVPHSVTITSKRFSYRSGECIRRFAPTVSNICSSKECSNNAIGGLSVGEPAEEMYAMTDVVCRILPKDKPRATSWGWEHLPIY